MFKLVIQDDEGKTTVVPLIRDEITIGRKEGNTIRLTERNVSRRHARILRNNGEVQIEDLGSYNGIRVNNARIAERVALRVSDQVQIGDYKLYLKAEGVEQVDDARTMPIERVDASTSAGSPTDVIAAVSPPGNGNGTPTMPLGIPQTPSPAGLAGAQLVGNPNRTLVAIADTDPAGRPVASAATVAALTTAVGYGKLVVLSSNFAGKEFELSRPQMIIGRTDENDIVINHRSISRNHAKLVRETDSGRYTISDLQSSNGVRVNGQDYGKVELRRGDVVDLGHVRLRFVEAGEDFVFARDAVITDVPDAGSKKGLLVAVVLGVVVLGGIGAFFATRSDKPKEKEQVVDPGNGTGSTNDQGIDAAVVAVEDGSGSDTVATNTNTPPEVDAGVATTNNSDKDLKLECLRYQADRQWADLEKCTNQLATIDSATAKMLRAKALEENKNETLVRKLTDALAAKNWKSAKTNLDAITGNSVYKAEARTAYDGATSEQIDDYERRASALARKNECKEMAKVVNEAKSAGLAEKAARVRCTEQTTVAVKNPGNGSNTTTTTTTTTTTPEPKCDADELQGKGTEYMTSGMDAAALGSFEKAIACKPSALLYKLAFMASCKAKNSAKAKLYYPRAKGASPQKCVENGTAFE